MSDTDVAIHYLRYCRKQISQEFFKDIVRDVPTQQLIKVVKQIEQANTIFVIATAVAITFLLLLLILITSRILNEFSTISR